MQEYWVNVYGYYRWHDSLKLNYIVGTAQKFSTREQAVNWIPSHLLFVIYRIHVKLKPADTPLPFLDPPKAALDYVTFMQRVNKYGL